MKRAILIKEYVKKHNYNIATVFVLTTLLLSYPFFTSYLNPGHDITFTLSRIASITESIRHMEIPARIDSIMLYGYGYPSEIFCPNLFYYIPAIFHLFGLSLINSYKMLVIAITLTTLLLMYKCVSVISRSEFAGIVASILYTSCPYRLVDIYQRADLGETLAIAFIPLVILGFYYIIFDDYKKWIVLLLAITFVFQSHILSTEFVAIFSALTVVIFFKKFINEKKRFAALLKSVAGFLLLNIWFIVPLVTSYFSKKYAISTANDVRNLHDESLYLGQIFMTYVKFGYSKSLKEGVNNEMPLCLGLPLILASLHILFYDQKKYNKLKEYKIALFFFLMGLLAVFFTLNIFPWIQIQNVHILNKLVSPIQFPWRFLEFASAFLAIAAGIIISIIYASETGRKVIALGVSIFVLVSGSVIMDDYLFQNIAYDNAYQGDISQYGISDAQYLLNNTNISDLNKNNRNIAANTRLVITDYKKSGTKIFFHFQSNYQYTKTTYFDLPVFNYPGYQAVIKSDGKESKLHITTGPNNILRVYAGKNTSGNITVSYVGMWYYHIADIISLLTIVALILVRVYFHKNNPLNNQ